MKKPLSIAIGGIVVFHVLFFAGCSGFIGNGDRRLDLGSGLTRIADAPEALADRLLGPLANAVRSDAEATLAYIDKQEKSGAWTPDVAAKARKCPEAKVRLLDAAKQVRDSFREATAGVGVNSMLLGTIQTYGQSGAGAKEDLKGLLRETGVACMDSVDPDKIVKMLALVR